MDGYCELEGVENWMETDGTTTPAAMTTGMKPIETTVLVFHIFFTIVPIFFSTAFAIVASRKIHISSDFMRYLLDFLIIIMPMILNVTVTNSYVEVICVISALVLYIVFKQNNISPFPDEKHVVRLGRQPEVLTMLRSAINIFTAVCIMAIDFSIFPKSFRKSRTYGVGLMDTGIGFFVFSMGTVSRLPRVRADFMRLPKIVGPVLFLGLARTVVIQTISYHLDETEYGVHMNAFFTLGFTKLIGGLISAFATKGYHLLLMGFIILAVHECVLQYGLARFVMDPATPRETFFLANREGICSLPGFITIYLISIFISQYIFSETTLTIGRYTSKLKKVAVGTICTWLVLFICIATIGISRRVANFGYVVWTFSTSLTMLLAFIILTDYALSTWPDMEVNKERPIGEETKIPCLMDATNRNGLVFFLIANILTGLVNIVLNPDARGLASSIGILTVYMFISTTVVYILLRMKIKIA